MSTPETQALNLTLPRGKHSPELAQGWRQGCAALMCHYVAMHSVVVLLILRERGENTHAPSINLHMFT